MHLITAEFLFFPKKGKTGTAGLGMGEPGVRTDPAYLSSAHSGVRLHCTIPL